MESCPRKEVENFKEKLVEENFYLITEVRQRQISASDVISLQVSIAIQFGNLSCNLWPVPYRSQSHLSSLKRQYKTNNSLRLLHRGEGGHPSVIVGTFCGGS